MHLVQLLLPLYDNEGQALPKSLFARVRDELVERFGGLTAYTRAPASGVWDDGDGRPQHDELVIYEVMAPTLDVAWWRRYREQLEAAFRQETLVVRTQSVQLL
jgi:hypothetical protein